MPNQASATATAAATARALDFDFVSRLARFFPDATPVRIPIRLSRAYDYPNGNGNGNGRAHGNGNSKAAGNNGDGAFAHTVAASSQSAWNPLQETVIEFGTPHEILFVVAQPLEFADHVLVESRDGCLRAEASIVAVQYHPERTVVAARFLKPVPNWIVKS